MKNKLKISFDFDNTLENEEVQKIAKDLISKGHNVCILTTRYKDPSNYSIPVTHTKLYSIASTCGITEINFTDYHWKHEVIDSLGIDIHIDDNLEDEVMIINNLCKARAILFSWYTDWIKELYDIILKKEVTKL
jgi:hypothetical protein